VPPVAVCSPFRDHDRAQRAANAFLRHARLVASNATRSTAPRWGSSDSAAALAVLAVSAGTYVDATPVGAATLHGLQSRYYLPVLPLALFSIYGIRLRRPRSTVLLLSALVVVVVVATLALLLRYYY
jgi:hypothetical protein